METPRGTQEEEKPPSRNRRDVGSDSRRQGLERMKIQAGPEGPRPFLSLILCMTLTEEHLELMEGLRWKAALVWSLGRDG